MVGTIGKSRYIDSLVKEGKLDLASIDGKWESFIIKVVKNPMKGVDRALVIAGSDRRGTSYGILPYRRQWEFHHYIGGLMFL